MNVKGKRLLILGAGRGQIGLYKAARELGIHTIAGTLPDNNPPGIPLADEVCYMNIANPEDVLEKAVTLQLDGVATCCLDTGIPALGRVCDTLSLTGLTEHAAILCGDKLKMKKAFMEHHVSTARFYEVSSEQDLAQAVENLRFPVIIKATDLQGSNGIYIARTRNEAEEGYAAVMDKTRRDYCIVEEFIVKKGYQVSGDGFSVDGKLVFTSYGNELYSSAGGTREYVALGEFWPSLLTKEQKQKVDDELQRLITALGMRTCAYNIEVILDENDTPYVLELGPRNGGSYIPQLIQYATGVDLVKYTILGALGEDCSDLKMAETKGVWSNYMIMSHVDGKFKGIRFEENFEKNNLLDVYCTAEKGDEVKAYKNTTNSLGTILFKAQTVEEMIRITDSIDQYYWVEVE